ncbi:MAG TPA: phosphoglycerate kinase [Candidatus Methanoculleus thermohydrogenotrophicum]|nr:phosphoglycerate kinase [Candidatus Methanoculleus thermohydrogenotrophicum]NLM81124.1 phosphoglycerate kinase [Candidatus Methanoculleus thermohydrogenotrophicum]HOB17129.1 phosphoglycerate kinase [Candidatus Methanoculleus thermohydrogenotrophicum]HPZ37209.1 phosphoglycerate kinase [Candidatus Methanoculleus thermohydrogenotrophicum]HQC90576.1 phosphoglycerate kinase [Candidatus Methanoculleus thermohydrogenotrophicum]
MEIGTLADAGKLTGTVLLRVDFNSPIDPSSNQILDDKRFREHLPTVQALEDSRLVVMTHQSRPGKKDYTTLEAHAAKLERLLGRPVTYVDDIFGRCAREAVLNAKRGDVLMLENLRFAAEENLTLKPEEAKKTILVRKLASMADIYVNDAFGTAHRSQPSIVGLPLALPSVAGLLMEKEIRNLSRVFTGAPRPVTFVLGGTKVDDSIAVAKNVLERGIADRVIVVGVVGNVFLLAAGYDIGRPSTQLIEQLGYLGEVDKAKDLLETYRDRIFLPHSVAVREGDRRAEYTVDAIPEEAQVLDLASESIDLLSREISRSGTVVVNGPAGLFEEEQFAVGTYSLLKAASTVEFSVVGGGHSAVAIERLGLEDRFSHISTGGGAAIEFLTGKKLPAIEALEMSREIFG